MEGRLQQQQQTSKVAALRHQEVGTGVVRRRQKTRQG